MVNNELTKNDTSKALSPLISVEGVIPAKAGIQTDSAQFLDARPTLSRGQALRGHDDPSLAWLGLIAHDEMLFRHRIAGGAEGFTNHFIGIKINLPVMIGVAVGAHGEHWPVEVKL